MSIKLQVNKILLDLYPLIRPTVGLGGYRLLTLNIHLDYSLFEFHQLIGVSFFKFAWSHLKFYRESFYFTIIMKH